MRTLKNYTLPFYLMGLFLFWGCYEDEDVSLGDEACYEDFEYAETQVEWILNREANTLDFLTQFETYIGIKMFYGPNTSQHVLTTNIHYGFGVKKVIEEDTTYTYKFFDCIGGYKGSISYTDPNAIDWQEYTFIKDIK